MSVGPFGDRQIDQFAELSARVLNLGGNRHLINLKKYSLCMAAPKRRRPRYGEAVGTIPPAVCREIAVDFAKQADRHLRGDDRREAMNPWLYRESPLFSNSRRTESIS